MLFTHDRGSDETLDLLASEVIARLWDSAPSSIRVRCRTRADLDAGARCAPFVGRLSSQTAGPPSAATPSQAEQWLQKVDVSG